MFRAKVVFMSFPFSVDNRSIADVAGEGNNKIQF